VAPLLHTREFRQKLWSHPHSCRSLPPLDPFAFAPAEPSAPLCDDTVTVILPPLVEIDQAAAKARGPRCRGDRTGAMSPVAPTVTPPAPRSPPLVLMLPHGHAETREADVAAGGRDVPPISDLRCDAASALAVPDAGSLALSVTLVPLAVMSPPRLMLLPPARWKLPPRGEVQVCLQVDIVMRLKGHRPVRAQPGIYRAGRNLRHVAQQRKIVEADSGRAGQQIQAGSCDIYVERIEQPLAAVAVRRARVHSANACSALPEVSTKPPLPP